MAIRVETLLLRTAFVCATFLLFGILADRTQIVDGGRNSRTTITDAAGYNIAATFSGVVALVGLAVAFWTYPVWTLRRAVQTVLGVIVAVAAFGLTVYASGIFWLARTRGEVFFYGTGEVLGNETYAQEMIHPAVGPPYFAAIAVVGIIATLGVGVLWLRQGDDA